MAIQDGPIFDVHAILRWRVIDLCQLLWDGYVLTIGETALSVGLRRMGYRRLSARPCHHAQAAGVIAAFKKVSPRVWTRSDARRAPMPAMSRSGSPTSQGRTEEQDHPALGQARLALLGPAGSAHGVD